MRLVYANATCVAALNGETRTVKEGDAWPADHPFVRANPGLFSDQPKVHGLGWGYDVEQATAAPGEKRNVRRAR